MLKNALQTLLRMDVTPIIVFGLIIMIWEKSLAGIVLAIVIISALLILALKSAKNDRTKKSPTEP